MHLVDLTMFYGGGGGGVGSYLDAKARWLASTPGWQHTIVSPNLPRNPPTVEFHSPPSTAAIPGLALPGLYGYRLPRSVSAAERMLLNLQPDLIEVGDAGPCGWAATRASQQLGIPLIGFYHSDLPRLLRARLGRTAEAVAQRYLRRLYSHCDLLLAPSMAMVQRLAAIGLPARHQPLGIDTSIFHPQRRDAALRAKLGLPPTTRLLVYAGRFTASKKLDVLVAAVKQLGAPYHLLLIGGRRQQRSSAVSILPYQSSPRALARLLASCDVLVHAGDCETFGLIVLEAMACGLPAVVTSAGGIGELVSAETGMVVAPDSAASLSEGIAALYEQDLVALGARARQGVCAHYDWRQIMPQLLARYRALADGDCRKRGSGLVVNVDATRARRSGLS